VIDVGRAVLFVISKAGTDHLFALVSQMGAQDVREADAVAPPQRVETRLIEWFTLVIGIFCIQNI
jgi:hypothetical protein